MNPPQDYHDTTVLHKMGLQGVYITPLHIAIMGTMSGAAVFSRLWHWASVMKCPFYKSDKDLMAESLCSAWELRQAKNRLKELSFVQIERQGIPAITWYTFDFEKLMTHIQQVDVKCPEKSNAQSAILSTKSDVRIPQNKISGILTSAPENPSHLYIHKDIHKINTTPAFVTPDGVSKDGGGVISPSGGCGETNTPPIKPKAELHPRWKRWALKLHDAVFQRTHVDRKRHLSQWAKQLSLLHKIDKVSLSRIRATLDWYCAAVVKNDDPYLPQGFSGQTFREKFAGIESKMNPGGKPAQKTIQFVQIVDGESKPEDDDLLFFEEEPKK